MSNLQTQAIERATQLKEQLGGTIFSFPIEEDNPFSSYAIVVYAGNKYFAYPEATNLTEASLGVLTIMEECKKTGMNVNYEDDVRLVSYQAQMDAPSTVMRRLKKENTSKPFIEMGKDVAEGNEETGELISARGLIKISYLMMVDENNPKASRFMDEYYKLLAMRKYGKTAAAIKQEVRRMGRGQVLGWLEKTYEKYIHDDIEVMNILNALGGRKV